MRTTRATQLFHIFASATLCILFVQSSPTSSSTSIRTPVRPVTRAELLAVLPRRQQLFAAVGGIGADLTDIHETVLDERHTLVRAAWQMRFDSEHEDAE